MSNNYTQGSGAGGNNHAAGHRRERDTRPPGTNMFNGTGALPSPMANPGLGRGYVGGFDFDEMIASLRELFAQDRQMASQQESRRCGICYLHSSPNELHYREEEGFYICAGCERSLGKQTLSMLRQQQK